MDLPILYRLIYAFRHTYLSSCRASLFRFPRCVYLQKSITSIFLVISIKWRAQANTRLLHANRLTRNSRLDTESPREKCYAAASRALSSRDEKKTFRRDANKRKRKKLDVARALHCGAASFPMQIPVVCNRFPL